MSLVFLFEPGADKKVAVRIRKLFPLLTEILSILSFIYIFTILLPLLWGLFTNYVDNVLSFFSPLFTCVDILYGMIFDKSGHLWTDCLPRLVNVVCEQPLGVI